MSYAANQGIRIHYRVEGEGPPLVLQHGFTQCIDDWYEAGYVDALKRDYRLILVDARGHGHSDKPHDPDAYGLDKWVADVTSVADAMGVAKAHFWGYSMGGWIGFGMAKYAHDRVDRLVIGGSHPYARDQSPARQFFRAHLGDSSDEFISALENRFGARVSAARKARLRAVDREAWLALSQDRPELSDILAGIRVPTCLYAGDADPLCPQAKAASRLIPGAVFFALPGLTHPGVFRNCDFVLPRVADFFGRGIGYSIVKAPSARKAPQEQCAVLVIVPLPNLRQRNYRSGCQSDRLLSIVLLTPGRSSNGGTPGCRPVSAGRRLICPHVQ